MKTLILALTISIMATAYHVAVDAQQAVDHWTETRTETINTIMGE